MKILINIVKFFVPIILIIMVSLDFAKGVISGEKESSKIIKNVGNKLLAAVLVFFIPTIIDLSLTLAGESNQNYETCWSISNIENIKKYRLIEEEERIKEREEAKIAAAKKYAEEEAKAKAKEIAKYSTTKPNSSSSSSSSSSGNLTPFVNGVQRALQKGECMGDDNCYCPKNGRFSGFSFTMADETSRSMASAGSPDGTQTVTVDCGDGTVYKKTVNKLVANNFEGALRKICELQTTGINGIKIDPKYLQVNGTIVKRTNSARTICSPHAYGTAIDINYSLVIKVNGEDYKPYAGQGKNTKKEYDRFVQALGGKEGHKQNVNYILWKYAFSPNGFSWGGNWSDGSFDPMHYEVSK